MAEQLTPDQINKLLAKVKRQEEISHNENIGCGVGATLVGIGSGIVGGVFSGGLGAVPAGLLGAAGGCIGGAGTVNMLYKTIDSFNEVIEHGSEEIKKLGSIVPETPALRAEFGNKQKSKS